MEIVTQAQRFIKQSKMGGTKSQRGNGLGNNLEIKVDENISDEENIVGE